MQDEPGRWWGVFDGYLVFLAEGPDGRGHVYRSDGTTAGTTRILSDFLGLSSLAQVGGRAVALGRAIAAQEGLYRLNVAAGTARFVSNEPIVLMDGFLGRPRGGAVDSISSDSVFYHFGSKALVATDGSSDGTKTLHSYLNRCGGRAYAQLSGVVYYGANALTDVFDGDGFVIGQEPSGCWVWRYDADPELFRSVAPVEMSDFHARDGWLYTVMRYSDVTPRVLSAFDGTLPPLDPGVPDDGYVQTVPIGMNVTWARSSASGNASYVYGGMGAADVVASVSGSPFVPVVEVLDADAGSVNRWEATFVGDRLVYVQRHVGQGTTELRAVGPTLSSSTTLLSAAPFTLEIGRLMADPYRNRAFFWTTRYFGEPDPDTGDQRLEVAFWVTNGTASGTQQLRVFCESDVGFAECDETFYE